MQALWQRRGEEWWLTDLSALPDNSGLSDRALPGFWQLAPYRTADFTGQMVLANPSQGAPPLCVPLPPQTAGRRLAVTLGLTVNYCDRVLVKLQRDPCYFHLRHSPASPADMTVEECWWRDVDTAAGDVLVIAQDTWMKRRCAVGFIKLAPAPPATAPQCELYATVDGLPGNDGPVDLDQMLANESRFAGTHVSAVLHGTDINGAAQYMTDLPEHRYPLEEVEREVYPDDEYYRWTVEQFRKYERAGRCPLRDSIAAAHRAGLKFHAYFRMAVTRMFAPYKSLFRCPFFDAHPQWRCVDFDGTPVARLSLAYPGVQRYFLEHFEENLRLGADGLCLVLARGWPLVLYEEPVAKVFREQTGRELRGATAEDQAVRQVWVDILTEFMRRVRELAGDRTVIVMTLATPATNRRFGFDCGAWARLGLVDVFVPYPYGPEAKPEPIEVGPWMEELRGSRARLCPVLNRMTYEPAGLFETPAAMVERAQRWLDEGVSGFTVWDMDSACSLPGFGRLASCVCSAEGRRRWKRLSEAGAAHHRLVEFDGLAVDRYHPGWNV